MPLPARFLLMQIIDGGSQQLMVGIHWPKANPVTIGSTENLSGLTHAFRLDDMTRHCFNCGWEWKLAHLPGRRDTCDECNTDLRCCRNCIHYDMIVAHQCRERRG